MGIFRRDAKKKAGQQDTPRIAPDKVKCKKCGAKILPATAKKYKGLCAPCAQRAKKAATPSGTGMLGAYPDIGLAGWGGTRFDGSVIAMPPRNPEKNLLTFENRSGMDALVKVLGTVALSVEVPAGQDNTVEVPSGRYCIKVRYGKPGNYTYVRGEEFAVVQTLTSSASVSITLHRVADGNYLMSSISDKVFSEDV